MIQALFLFPQANCSRRLYDGTNPLPSILGSSVPADIASYVVVVVSDHIMSLIRFPGKSFFDHIGNLESPPFRNPYLLLHLKPFR